MATYKLLQDIEAEDKLLGPLTLRQFIYGLIAAACAYFVFLGFNRGAWPLIVVFAPIMFLTAFFAFPWGRDQPTEVWTLAKIRFLAFPRRRIWNQDGKKELVTITVPKKVDPHYTDGLSRNEVQSRLQALASTIDSRGWATKNVGYNNGQKSDRLIDPGSLTHEVAEIDERPQDDIMDEVNNQTAANFNQMITTADANRREQLMSQMKSANLRPATSKSSARPKNGNTKRNPGDQNNIDTTKNESELSADLKARKKEPKAYRAHLNNVEPLSSRDKEKNANTQESKSTPNNQAKGDKIEASRQVVEQARLAQSNDFTISTIAREVNRKPAPDESEVVISLHGD